MIGTNKFNIVLQPRDRLILEALGTARVATRQQLQALCGFNSQTRASARLSQLAKAGLLKVDYVGTIAGGRCCIYFLPAVKLPANRGPAGREAAVLHQLAINDVRVQAHRSATAAHAQYHWDGASPLLNGALKPDARLQMAGVEQALLIEVDRETEGLVVWRGKVDRYLMLAQEGHIAEVLGTTRFGVLVVASTERRVRRIRAEVVKRINKLFWFTTHQQLTSDGFLGRVWLRPKGEGRMSLLKESHEVLSHLPAPIDGEAPLLQ